MCTTIYQALLLLKHYLIEPINFGTLLSGPRTSGERVVVVNINTTTTSQVPNVSEDVKMNLSPREAQ